MRLLYSYNFINSINKFVDGFDAVRLMFTQETISEKFNSQENRITVARTVSQSAQIEQGRAPI